MAETFNGITIDDSVLLAKNKFKNYPSSNSLKAMKKEDQKFLFLSSYYMKKFLQKFRTWTPQKHTQKQIFQQNY